MKLIIDIDDNVYDDIEHNRGEYINTLNWAVRNGTPISTSGEHKMGYPQGDVISRRELIKEMCIKFYTTHYYASILNVIYNAPTVSERPQGEWISVSERLPEENVCDDGYHEPSKWVLVQARNGHMYTTRYWTRDKKNVWTDLDYPDDIIAWRPLPEPYKENDAE